MKKSSRPVIGMSTKSRTAIFMVAIAVTGCAGKSTILTPLRLVPLEPMRVVAETTTLALAPTEIMVELEDAEPVRAEFDSIIEAAARDAGFAVLPPGTADSTLSSKADFVLFPTVEVIAIAFTKGRVTWLGASECIPMRWYMPGCGPYEGTTEALVLFLTMVDMDGVVVFRNGGGIQLLRKIPPTLSAGLDIVLGGTIGVLVPRDQLFVDEEQNLAAVNNALAPFLVPQEAGR